MVLTLARLITLENSLILHTILSSHIGHAIHVTASRVPANRDAESELVLVQVQYWVGR